MLLQAGAKRSGSSISGCIAVVESTYSPPPVIADLCYNNALNYAAILRSCIVRRAIEPGKQVHAHMLVAGRGYNIDLATKLVNLYCATYQMHVALVLAATKKMESLH